MPCCDLKGFSSANLLFSSNLVISKEDRVLLEILARRHDNTYLDELFVKFPDFYLDLIFKV